MMFTIGLSMSWFSDLSSNPAPSGKDSCLLLWNVSPGRIISVNWSVCKKLKMTAKQSGFWEHGAWETSHNWRFIKEKIFFWIWRHAHRCDYIFQSIFPVPFSYWKRREITKIFSQRTYSVHTNFVPCKFGKLFKGSFFKSSFIRLKNRLTSAVFTRRQGRQSCSHVVCPPLSKKKSILGEKGNRNLHCGMLILLLIGK